MDLRDDMLSPEGDLLNPTHPDGEPPMHVLHYRNYRGRKLGLDGVGRPVVSARHEYNLWAAGNDCDPQRPESAWEILRP